MPNQDLVRATYYTSLFYNDQAKKKILFVSCNGLKKNRVRLVKKFFDQKCVLCIFYVDWELEGQKKLRGRVSFE